MTSLLIHERLMIGMQLRSLLDDKSSTGTVICGDKSNILQLDPASFEQRFKILSHSSAHRFQSYQSLLSCYALSF